MNRAARSGIQVAYKLGEGEISVWIRERVTHVGVDNTARSLKSSRRIIFVGEERETFRQKVTSVLHELFHIHDPSSDVRVRFGKKRVTGILVDRRVNRVVHIYDGVIRNCGRIEEGGVNTGVDAVDRDFRRESEVITHVYGSGSRQLVDSHITTESRGLGQGQLRVITMHNEWTTCKTKTCGSSSGRLQTLRRCGKINGILCFAGFDDPLHRDPILQKAIDESVGLDVER